MTSCHSQDFSLPITNFGWFSSTLSDAGAAVLIVEVDAMQNLDDKGDFRQSAVFWQKLWAPGGKATCNALLLDHTDGNKDAAFW